MKGSIGNIWLVGIVITFLFIFSAYITVTMNYSKTFKYKNEILSIIEKKKGIRIKSGRDYVSSKIPGVGSKVWVPHSALGTINVYLSGSGYTVKGKCPLENTYGVGTGGKEIWYGVSELTNGDGNYIVEQITSTNKDKDFYYCFSKKGRNALKSGTFTRYNCENNKKIPYYYDIVLFYRLDFPIIGDLFTFRVDGTTADIYKITNDNVGGATKHGCSYV